jgi:site-specific DNA recombinase
VTRAAGYVRVSTGRQAAEGDSLPEQERRIREHAAAQGWDLVNVYVDAGISGRRDDRPGLQRLLGDLDCLDVLVIPRLDRLGRSVAHLARTFERLEEAGVALVSLNEAWLDTTTPVGRLVRTILAAVAELEAANASERIAAVTHVRARDGRPHGGPRVFGYAYAGGRLAVVAHEAAVVRRIFEEFVAGRSQMVIARDLTRDRIPPARGRSGAWHQSSVRRILGNSTYRGLVRLQGIEYDGRHEAIVSAELWEEAARLREGLRATSGAGRGRPARRFVLRGLLRCGECGSAMVPRTTPNRNGSTNEVYGCYGRLRDRQTCGQKPVRRPDVDGAVFEYFENVGLDIEETRRQFELRHGAVVADTRAMRDEAEREEQRVEASLARIRRDYVEGRLGAEDWQSLRAELDEEREATAARLDLLRERERELSAEAGPQADAYERLARLRAAIAGRVNDAHGVEAVRAAIVTLFESFTLHQAGEGVAWQELALGDVYLEPQLREEMVLRPPLVMPDNFASFDCPYDGPIPLEQALREGVNGPIDFEYRQVAIRLDQASDNYPKVKA